MDLLEKGKISGFQFFALLVTVRLVPVTLFCPTVNMVTNPATAWLNDLIGSLLALPLVWLLANLSLKHPGKSIIGYAEDLLGPIAGKMAGFLIICFYFMVAATVIRTLGETLVTSIMQATPLIVFVGSAAFLAANSARNGMELNSRTAAVLTPTVVFLLISVSFMAFGYMDLQYLRPIYFPDGLTELVWPSASVLSFYTEFLVIGMLVPHLNRPEQAIPISIGAILFSLGVLLMYCFVIGSVFGPLFNSLTLPAFRLARTVSIGTFLERVEPAVTVVWIFSACVKFSLFVWATAVGLSQLLGLSDYRPMIYPMGALIVPVSILSYQGVIELLDTLTGSMIVFAIGFLLFLLLSLYVAWAIRISRQAEGGSSN